MNAQDLIKLYGKKTYDRVKICKISGSDSYSYYIKVDGVVRLNGLTKREAEYYRRNFLKKLHGGL